MITIDQEAKHIYVEHIGIYLQTGNGYSEIRKYLLEDLAKAQFQTENQQIIKFINEKLLRQILTGQSGRVQRAIEIIQDLIQNVGQIFSRQINNNEDLCVSLYSIVVSTKITLHWKKWAEMRLRICEIFMFWFQKYQFNEYQYRNLIKWYRKLRQAQVEFPKSVRIYEKNIRTSENEKFESQNQSIRKSENSKQIPKLVKFCELNLSQMEKYIINSQNVLKKGLIQTAFVRQLKKQSKILYDISVNEAATLTAEQKTIVGAFYKRIRTILKQIDQINDKKQAQIKRKEGQKYSAEKVSLASPKKIQMYSQKNNIQQKPNQTNLLNDSSPIKNYNSKEIDLLNDSSPIKNSNSELLKIGQFNDLLDISTPKKQQNQQKAKQKVKATQTSNLLFLEESPTAIIKQKNEMWELKLNIKHQQNYVQQDSPKTPQKKTNGQYIVIKDNQEHKWNPINILNNIFYKEDKYQLVGSAQKKLSDDQEFNQYQKEQSSQSPNKIIQINSNQLL